MSADTHDAREAFLREPGEATFGPVYEATKRLVWTLCLCLLRHEADASEAFQTTYCRLVELARRTGTAQAADLAAGVGRLAIREADSLRKRRSRRRAREVSLESMEPRMHPGSAPDTELARREIRQRVEAIVDELPELHRLPVQLHFFHGLSQREVAHALGQPLSTVADRIQRGLDRLEPAFRRAGLKEAAATLGALVVSGALFEPGLSAAVVYSQAQAALAAASTTGSLIATTSILGGLSAMKLKAATIAAILVALLAGGIAILGPRLRQPDAGDDAGALATPAATPAVPRAAPEAPTPPAPAAETQSIAVQVLWSESAAPAAGARVSWHEGDGEAAAAASGPVELEAGADGSVVLSAPAAWRTARLRARHELGGVTETDVVLPHEGVLAIRIEEDVVTGTVADAATGEALPGAVVRCGEREAVADAEGGYSLRGLGAGEHLLMAAADGHADQAGLVRRERPETTLQTFRLDPAAALTVVVVDAEGAPLSGASVTPSHLGNDGVFHGDKTRKTDSRGVVRFEKISKLRPPELQATADGYANAYTRPAMDPARGEAEHRIVLERKRESRRAIVGRIADAAGNAIAGAVVEWKDGEGTQYGDGAEYGKIRAFSDSNGRYRLVFDDDFDRCYLGVAARNWAPIVAAGVIAGTPERPLEMSFTLEPAHWLRGRVVDEDRKPLAGVSNAASA
jgi:RNA polymerase sigma-70 factor (ECF subfamily)